MAMYHMHAQVISRAAGRSAVAAAAYRSGERLVERSTGRAIDYTPRQRTDSVVRSAIVLPRHADERLRDRETLWNEVEAVERDDRSQLCREVVLALPRELSQDERLELAAEIAQSWAAEGMVVDYAVHRSHDGQNPHMHAMMPMRGIDPDTGGFEKSKAQKLYWCRLPDLEERHARQWMSGEQIKAAKSQGLEVEKHYRYHGEQLTQSEAAERGLTNADRDSRSPIDRKEDRHDWNTPEAFERWRKAYEQMTNDKLEVAYERDNVELRERSYIDRRSYRDQALGYNRDDERLTRPVGRELTPELAEQVIKKPTQHMGHEAASMERRAKAEAEREGREYTPVTRVGQANEQVREGNVLRDVVRTLIERDREGLQAALKQAPEEVREWARKAYEQAQERVIEPARKAVKERIIEPGRDLFQQTRERAMESARRIQDEQSRQRDRWGTRIQYAFCELRQQPTVLQQLPADGITVQQARERTVESARADILRQPVYCAGEEQEQERLRREASRDQRTAADEAERTREQEREYRPLRIDEVQQRAWEQEREQLARDDERGYDYGDDQDYEYDRDYDIRRL